VDLGGIPMRKFIQGMFIFCLLTIYNDARADSDSDGEIEQLRAELKLLRDSYDQRIASLELRLQAAENKTIGSADETPGQQDAELRALSAISKSSNNAFNPAIGIIFQGQAWSYQNDAESYSIPGFPLGGEAGPVAEGLSLGETEIDISANVDDLFTAWLTVPIVIEDGETVVEVEEAWIETLALPAGLSLRMGRFFSDIGYLNDKHSHSWDFVDQPLAYQAFLGNQYIDDGAQLRWIAPTDLYFELGAEVLRGDRYPSSGADSSGFGAWSMHARVGGDAGFSSSWLAGLSYLSTESIDRQSGDESEPLLFNGDADVLLAEFVWKWSPNGNWKQRNFKFQAEYLWRDEQGFYSIPHVDTLAWDIDQEGWYMQAIYQAKPGWRFGARYDALSSDNPGVGFANTALALSPGDPMRYSLMADWSHSEFSRLRLQYTHDQAGLQNDEQWGLQYIYSIGAHGAHSF
jgi:hypothetical protein